MRDARVQDRDRDPGVPEALPRTLLILRDRVGEEAVDRLWIFPALRRGRKESGLLAVSCFLGGGGDGRRTLLTATYSAERTGRALTLDHSLTREGEAPPDLLPRVMEGVVRRSAEGLGDPRVVDIGGDPERFEALLSEFDLDLFERVDIDA